MTRWVTPNGVFTLGLIVTITALPAVIWAFHARLPPDARLRFGLSFIVAGMAIAVIGWLWIVAELPRRQYRPLKRRKRRGR